MPSLQVLCHTGVVIHLLVACLFLETVYGQDNKNNTLSLDMKISPVETEDEFGVELIIKNNVDECVGVKVSPEGNPNVKYLSAHAAYTACICTEAKFSWNIEVSEDTALKVTAEVVPAKDICPEGENIHPETGYIGTITREIPVRPQIGKSPKDPGHQTTHWEKSSFLECISVVK